MTLYVTDMSKDMEHFGPIKDEFVPAPYPAVTGVEISRLVLPGLLIEIKVVAVIGAGAN
jgi:enamine deaminase RidA (YjgF/YER057c/UK114 family)